MARENQSTYLKELWQWIQAILFAIIIAFLIRGFIFEPVLVQGESMKSTLSTGERLIVYKLGYYFTPPQKGDIVVLQIQEGASRILPFLRNLPFVKKVIPDLEEVDYIKRVIAVPGDKIEIRDGKVFVNDKMLDEPYAIGFTSGLEKTVQVPPNKVFVLGDNRENSRDSREIGCIDYDRIKGKAVFRFWPVEEFGSLR